MMQTPDHFKIESYHYCTENIYAVWDNVHNELHVTMFKTKQQYIIKSECLTDALYHLENLNNQSQ